MGNKVWFNEQSPDNMSDIIYGLPENSPNKGEARPAAIVGSPVRHPVDGNLYPVVVFLQPSDLLDSRGNSVSSIEEAAIVMFVQARRQPSGGFGVFRQKNYSPSEGSKR